MPPARKKSKLANDDNGGTDAVQQQQQQASTATANGNINTAASTPADANAAPSSPTTSPPSKAVPPNNRGSWYSSSSWRSKAQPVVAQVSVSVDKGVSSESSGAGAEGEEKRRRQSVRESFKGSRKSGPVVAEETRVVAGMRDVSLPPRKGLAGEEKSAAGKGGAPPLQERKEAEAEAAPLPPQPDRDTVVGDSDAKSVDAVSMRASSGTWFGWWSRPDGYGRDGGRGKSDNKAKLDEAADADAGSNVALPETPDVAPGGDDSSELRETNGEDDKLRPEMSVNTTTTRSWFGLWSSTQNQQAAAEKHTEQEEPAPDVDVSTEPGAVTEALKKPEEAAPPAATKADDERPKSSGWAFWSSDRAKDCAPGESAKQVGELAVADTPSQSHPEAAQFNEEREESKMPQADIKRSGSLLRLKRSRPEKSKDVVVPEPASDNVHETPHASGNKSVQTKPNLVLPAFRDTYPPAPSPGLVDRLTQYMAQSLHIPGFDASRPPQHPFLSAHPPKIRKAIAIGVHGFFPAPLLQRVLGQPTGTSIRFANYAAASIKQWCHQHQPEVKDVEVEKVALEGEGFVADRVATLWKLLLNWLSHLRQADFILVACHSQGVPVALMLIAKLIQLGALNPHVRVGVCAMAGINLGPFVDYKSRLFSGSALELFDFCDSKSKVSMAYSESLDVCLRQGVRVTFVGSIDDQLVSLESSLHTPLSHPYVSRAVFIDGRLHSSNFLTHLVVFAVKLRNLGVSDHGLLREISGPVAGSLVAGDGHSRVYDDPAVYQNAIEFALESSVVPASSWRPHNPPSSTPESTDTHPASRQGYPSSMLAANNMRRGSLSSLTSPGIPPVIAPFEAQGATGAAEKNPFVLPWAVRGMLEEDAVKHDPKMMGEVKELVSEFEDWRPGSKVLKDVRWRLEGVRSML